LRIQNAAQEIHQNRGILNRVRLSWTRGAEAFALQTMASILSHFFDFILLLTITVFLLCRLSLCCFLNKLQALFYHHFTNFYQQFMMKLKKRQKPNVTSIPRMTERLDILGWSYVKTARQI
jgi:hypothetical protein